MARERAPLIVGEVAPHARVRRSREPLGIARVATRARGREVFAVELEPRMLFHGCRGPGVLGVTVCARVWKDAHVHGVRRCRVGRKVAPDARVWCACESLGITCVAIHARGREVFAVELEPRMLFHGCRSPGVLGVTVCARVRKDAHVHGVRRRRVGRKVAPGAVRWRSRVARGIPGVATRARRGRVLPVEHEPMMIRQGRRAPAVRGVARAASLRKHARVHGAHHGGESSAMATHARLVSGFLRVMDILCLRTRAEREGDREDAPVGPHRRPMRGDCSLARGWGGHGPRCSEKSVARASRLSGCFPVSCVVGGGRECRRRRRRRRRRLGWRRARGVARLGRLGGDGRCWGRCCPGGFDGPGRARCRGRMGMPPGSEELAHLSIAADRDDDRAQCQGKDVRELRMSRLRRDAPQRAQKFG